MRAASPLRAGSRAGPRPEPRREAAPGKARPFPLEQVRLLSGTCYTLQDRNRVDLHTLDSDRHLHTFRLAAGLPSKAPALGGWERPDIELRGQPIPAPALIAPSADPGDWIRPAGDATVDRRDVEVVAGSPGDWKRAAADGGLPFHIIHEGRPLSLIPLNRLFGQRFAVYWRVKEGGCR